MPNQVRFRHKFRDAQVLERMERVDTLVVDKTGTLTEGRPKVVQVTAARGFDPALPASLLPGPDRPGAGVQGRVALSG